MRKNKTKNLTNGKLQFTTGTQNNSYSEKRIKKRKINKSAQTIFSWATM